MRIIEVAGSLLAIGGVAFGAWKLKFLRAEVPRWIYVALIIILASTAVTSFINALESLSKLAELIRSESFHATIKTIASWSFDSSVASAFATTGAFVLPLIAGLVRYYNFDLDKQFEARIYSAAARTSFSFMAMAMAAVSFDRWLVCGIYPSASATIFGCACSTLFLTIWAKTKRLKRDSLWGFVPFIMLPFLIVFGYYGKILDVVTTPIGEVCLSGIAAATTVPAFLLMSFFFVTSTVFLPLIFDLEPVNDASDHPTNKGLR